MLDIQITRTAAPKAKPADESQLGFGKMIEVALETAINV